MSAERILTRLQYAVVLIWTKIVWYMDINDFLVITFEWVDRYGGTNRCTLINHMEKVLMISLIKMIN
jgi:hypothetical protein